MKLEFILNKLKEIFTVEEVNSGYVFSKNSLKKLEKVDPRLKRLAIEVLKVSKVDFTIVETLRTKKRQKELFNKGKTKTLNSKHLNGLAMDICPYIKGKVDFNSQKDLFYLVGLFDATAKLMGIKIRLGAFWDHNTIKNNSFVDGYHIELLDN